MRAKVIMLSRKITRLTITEKLLVQSKREGIHKNGADNISFSSVVAYDTYKVSPEHLAEPLDQFQGFSQVNWFLLHRTMVTLLKMIVQ